MFIYMTTHLERDMIFIMEQQNRGVLTFNESFNEWKFRFKKNTVYNLVTNLGIQSMNL